MQLYEFQEGVRTAWFTGENPLGLPGQAARLNKGAKGRPSVWIKAGKRLVLVDTAGPGVIRRIWLTATEQHTRPVLRGMRLRMHWDGEAKPAVDCPLGDFFGVGLGRKAVFESALFADPEGRSFNGFAPMPFRKRARIELWNETPGSVQVFYQVDATLGERLPAGTLYFHAHWRRENPNRLGRDYTLLPEVKGRGRFLGCNVGLKEGKGYEGGWFGEGEIKAWLDGDRKHPSLAGTGTEDYIGTAWGQGKFAQLRSGCTVKDEKRGEWCFYRQHVDDPIWFSRAARVTLQVMGGAFWSKILAMKKLGARLKVIAVMEGEGQRLVMERGMPKKVRNDQWANFWRQDDVSSVAYFYLDKPAGQLPQLPPLKRRL